MLPANFTICMPEVLEKVTGALGATGQRSVIFLFDKAAAVDKNDKYLTVKEVVEDDSLPPDEAVEPAKGLDDLTVVYWSSGSTGRPKGIRQPYRVPLFSLVTRTTSVPGGAWVMGTWMFHVGGFGIPLAQMCRGESVFFIQPDGVSPERVFKAIGAARARVGIYSYHDVVRFSNYANPDGVDVSSLILISPVGAKVPDDCPEKLRKVFPGLRFIPNYYGSTELGGISNAKDIFTGGTPYLGIQVMKKAVKNHSQINITAIIKTSVMHKGAKIMSLL